MNRHNFDHLATTPTPALKCVCCSELLHSYWQPALMPSRDGHWLVECHNNEIDCLMPMQTFSADNYPPQNLTEYLAHGERVRSERLARLPEAWRTA